ncbi:MAG: hypothetical protein K8I01_07840 [Candidatus Methylomirabilis sp.]|nr:hypothetical protein [Deltaproteobacteria bacterium]
MHREAERNNLKLVCVVKDWDWPDILRQTPGGKGVWDGLHFSTDAVECDALVILNNRLKREVRATCPKENVWALMQEPYVRGFTDWMVEGHVPFAHVLTSHPADSSEKYVLSQPAVPWHVNHTFDQLTTIDIPDKSRPLSWVVGNCKDLPGHMDRFAFLKTLQCTSDIPADLFGRAVRPIEDKWDGLAPYRFSLAIENTVSTDYWTEKIADCFLSWTVPIYHGCPNLANYFPQESYVHIDIRRPAEALAAIRKVLNEDALEWKRRLPALVEARRRVLYEYQLFPHLTRMLRRKARQDGNRDCITIPPYRRSLKAGLWRRISKAKMSIKRLAGAND